MASCSALQVPAKAACKSAALALWSQFCRSSGASPRNPQIEYRPVIWPLLLPKMLLM